MIKELHPRFRVVSSSPPLGKVELRKIDLTPPPPDEYLELVREATELEIADDEGGYLRIWTPRGIKEMDEAYGISSRIPEALPIGDDGGGRVLIYMVGLQGFGLYLSGFGDLSVDDALWVAPTLRDLLTRAEGADALQ